MNANLREPTTRSAARSAGLVRFLSTKPCPKCGSVERYVCNNLCVDCLKRRTSLRDLAERGTGPRARLPLEQRFWRKVDRSGGPEACWPWTASVNRAGYGQIGKGSGSGKTLTASRLSWELHHGPITDGLFVLHRCDNPPCVNPEHLFLGTCSQNTQDMIAKGRWNKPPRMLGERNPASRLTVVQVAEIKLLAGIGFDLQRIGQLYAINGRTIESIIATKTWKEVKPMKIQFNRYRKIPEVSVCP